MFGSHVFLLKQPPPIYFVATFSDESQREQAEKPFAWVYLRNFQTQDPNLGFSCFETLSLPSLHRRDPCGFAFYVT
jgi:hypothetical protein